MGGFRCCSAPNGPMIFVPMIFSTCALGLSLRATRWCDYIQRDVSYSAGTGDPNLDNVNDGALVMLRSRKWGIWAYELLKGEANNDDECKIYYDLNKEPPFDTKWHAAMGFSICTSVVGGLTAIFIWFTSCLGVNPKWWRLIGMLLLLACLFEGLTLLVLRSEICQDTFTVAGILSSKPDCSLTTGARCGIAATACWFAGALPCCKMPPPQEDEPVVIQQTTTTTTTVQEDGTKVVKETTEAHVVEPVPA